MLELRILTGLNRGAALPLEGETIRFGSGAENDIVLLDPGMPQHAGVLERSGDSAWRYRTCASSESCGDAIVSATLAEGKAIVSGSRWFAGPVLIGCDDESTPWHAKPVPPEARSPHKRAIALRTKRTAAAIAGIAACTIVALLFTSSGATPGRNVAASESRSAIGPVEAMTPKPEPSVRTVKGTVYPSGPIARPPFSIRSASAGPYAFVVTDDGRVLTPGSRWQAFTLERIEPGRATFAGPHTAELTW
ncbi:FHA domain-containing protein [Trinickia acidisoli]|uniref:FHA domain-containing protein n=1 Tax=Trinickia acidisoli TaxID=2767482 RepID=UPI001A8DE152|nr:FHA domain-containing protein [Trinickia acidisoli]